ncbi:hypothetical protein BCR32DRAFT_278700 [Anaeromyces robustus]|uniref:N-acetyltransferase domain-containing protein n=1 Tax=Anaeromyces robustus TaxID=1754192 RepID=A0A1Y1XA56_9FUNG|nr:hypothetical protein BCR32DRAFT_278700 [Anaeromyces robustus]|eukprot:ORX82632.1 hypothetical protein BCR32DRAFT_278700 [Anaeromyces robustus]
MENNNLIIKSLDTLKEINASQKNIIINNIQKLEKKIFPKNEQMDISAEIKKRTNTLIIAMTKNNNYNSEDSYSININKNKNKNKNNNENEKNKLKKKKSKINSKNMKQTSPKLNSTNSDSYNVQGYLIYSKKDSIIKFAVDPSKRNQGTGWKLLSYSLQRMTNQAPKEHKINLSVDINRLPAQYLYKKAGFKIKEQINDYYEPNRHAYIMEYTVT